MKGYFEGGNMKIVKIERCLDCQYLKEMRDIYEMKIEYLYCGFMVKSPHLSKISWFDKIPSWCPLEDYKNENNKD